MVTHHLLRQSTRLAPSLRRLLSTGSSHRALSIKAALESTSTPEQLTINGWVRSCRRQKNISFAVINDGTNVKGIQAVLPKGLEEGITVGCSASLRGTLVDSPGKGQAKEFRAEWVEVLGESDAESYPIPNTKQGVPAVVLRRNAHLRPRANAAAAMLRMRSEMAWAAHDYFRNDAFVQIQTPLITSSDCEGAGEVFRIETGPATPPPSPFSTPDRPPPPPPPPRYLTVSSQLHLEAIASSLPKVYTLSPSFRAEKSDTARHLQEFWMLEAEAAFLPPSEPEALDEVMNIAEGVVRAVVSHLSTHNASDLAYFDSVTPGLGSQLSSLLLDPTPFPRLSYTSAISILASHAETHPEAFVFPPIWGSPLQTEHEKWLAESHARGPIFVTDYPTPLKPFYMLPNPCTEAGRETVACFDLLVPRLGELAGGSLREHREAELVAAMKAAGVELEPYEWYLELRRYGTTRHGGFGMGWERLVAWVTGQENVRDCIAFPRAAEGSRF